MSDQLLATLVDRLESVTKRLEAIEKNGGGSGSAAAGGNSGSAGDDSETVARFDDLVKEFIDPWMAASKKIGGETAEIAAVFREAVTQLRNVIAGATQAKKPSDADLAAFVKPLSEAMLATTEFRNSRRGSKEWEHLSTVSEGVAAFAWVCMPTPHPFAVQTRAGAEFYSNKLLRQYRDKDETQESWIKNFTGFFKAMEDYIKEFHRAGLSFTGTGEAKPATGGAPKAAAGGPPPPMPKAPLVNKADLAKAGGESKPNRGGLFAELNQGGAITSGLKKVTRDMQTHKNKALRAGGMVKAAAVKKGPKKHRGIPSGTPKGPVLEGNKWVVEFIHDGGTIDIEPELKHSLYIYGCVNTVVNVKSKINQIQVDSCKKTSVVVPDVLATIDCVNCNSCQVQVLGKSPTISIEKTSGFQVYLSKEGLDVEIITAKSDSVNVSVPQADDEFLEFPVPEQFKTVVVDGALKTTEVEHGD